LDIPFTPSPENTQISKKHSADRNEEILSDDGDIFMASSEILSIKEVEKLEAREKAYLMKGD
jgi:hypothetical protein